MCPASIRLAPPWHIRQPRRRVTSHQPRKRGRRPRQVGARERWIRKFLPWKVDTRGPSVPKDPVKSAYCRTIARPRTRFVRSICRGTQLAPIIRVYIHEQTPGHSRGGHMDRSTCDCGTPILRAVEDLGCIECGRPCCPVCAYTLESVAYCALCAAQFLEPAGPRRGRRGSA